MKNNNYLKALILSAVLTPVSLVSLEALAQDQPEPTYTIGSNELDILKFIRIVADATGKTMVIDPSVKGKVKIMTNNNEMNKDELYELFRSVLELSNFTVIEVGKVTKVVPIKDARTGPVADASPTSGLHEIVTDVIPAQNIAASKLLAALRPMVSTNANLTHHDGSNSIIITDTKANIDRIRRVISKIDLAAIATTEIVQLKYAEADQLVQTLTKLDAADKKAAGLSNKLQMVADKRNNAIILAGEDVQRDRVKKLIRRLDRPAAQTGNVRVVYLEYADATKVAETLTKVLQNISKLAPGGGDSKTAGGSATVEADEDTNALLLTAEGDTLESMLQVIERLDIRRAQVLVEAIIVEITISDGAELGTEWLFSDSDGGIIGKGPGTEAGGTQAAGLGAALLGEDASLDSAVSALASITDNVIGVAGTDGSQSFLTLVKALNNSSVANILSTPSLLTMDNSEAEISIGREVPFTTGSYSATGTGGGISSPFTTTQRESVGIMLKVTPQINEGDKVLLTVEQEVSGIDNSVTSASGDFVTNESRISTQIMAQDGQIVVLGGLMEEETDESSQKVPFLGSIPILGYLFKYQVTTTSKKNLMVFLRAKIVRDDEVMNAASAEKYQMIREAQLQQREKGLPLLRDSHIPVLPEVSFEDLKARIQAETAEDTASE